MSKFIDLTGQKFERLTVIKWIRKNKQSRYKWLCRCDCGQEVVVLGYNLRNGHTKSCGCLNKEKITKHGLSGIPMYHVWEQIIQRCTNPNCKEYKNYGGRGITVCERWLKFENFNKDMGKSWKSGLTIERTKNEEGYYKENCEWVTSKINSRNKRNNRLLTHNGVIQCVTAWSEETGINKSTIFWRLRAGWSTKRTLTTPVQKHKGRK